MIEISKQDIEKADILINSLAYIKDFHQKIVVIKYGGHAMISEEMRQRVISDIAWLSYVGMKPIIVHGGGPEINRMLEMQGVEPHFINGLRVTSSDVMRTVEMVLTGLISPNLTTMLNEEGVSSVSVSGKDNKVMEAVKKDESLGLVGQVTNVNTDYLNQMLDDNMLPVISPIAYGPKGESLNINSDEAAAAIASALKAEKMIYLTDINGIYEDPADPSTLHSVMSADQIQEAIKNKIITGGMIPKVENCLGAIQSGVHSCQIIDGTIPHAIILELFTKNGIGTMITA
ncbi:acetylglutamate kinase [Carnobacterium sp. PL24RED07]|uniref:acetylglutamate kinase n=1 Tax=unclassified Carnobacterium TaxID=257487 RepID=UPI0011EE8C10|nr:MULTISPECIES: acetylglutamate kinase [unclassified Carnobacterium]KAF3303310.1 acetylglutamate kinase [Carnobacterium sp. PL26RED25]KAF3306594.1 acetylglutamate kinase [Carnobacterium sp. PL24RED07]